MRDYSQIIGKFTSAPWMITPSALKQLIDIFEAHLDGKIGLEEVRERMATAKARSQDDTPVRRSGKIGVLNVTGPIFPKANLMTDMSGATSVEQFRSDFRMMLNDDAVSAILIDIDSPGGYSAQIDEMATEIRESREVKPIYAIANTDANSAAYYLASQASELYATPSGRVGSIGTYIVVETDNRKREAQGIDTHVIKSGRFKAIGEEQLTQEQYEYIQDHVNEVNDLFIQQVATGRNRDVDEVRVEWAHGGIFTPQHAEKIGLVDGVRSYDQVIQHISESMTGGGQLAVAANVGVGTTSNVASADVTVRQSYDADKEHSEPGTGQGGEPTPRTPPEEGDPAIEGGWRRDPPPIAYELEEEQMDRTWLEARAGVLGIEFSDDTTDEQLADAIATKVDDIIVPLNQATQQAEEDRKFAEDYPEQAAELLRLAEKDRQIDAKTFAGQYERLEGNKGLSSLVRQTIEESYNKVGTRQFGSDDLKNLIDKLIDKTAMVDWSEHGSSRQGEEDGEVAATSDFAKDRQKFAELVRSAMRDDNLDRNAAIAHVSKMHPELAKSYAVGHTRG